MATIATTTRPAHTQLATYGEVTEGNDRIARLELAPGRQEGDHLGLMLRCWGEGHWCRADGQPAYFTYRMDADTAAERWISTGRR